jgi:ABC-type Fe3+/spermidine/putrescine transport system ATPase subunit
MAREVFSIFSESTARVVREPDPKATLCVRRLTKNYGDEHVLDDVSFSVADGESLVLLGHSGSGKSTTMRLIAGLETPDSGEIFLHGKRVDHLRARDRNVGVIFQHYALFPRMTVAENIGFGLKIRRVKSKKRAEVIERMLEMIGLVEQRDKYPWQISGGQQQRVAIARALAYEPDVLFFDESFSALDPQTRVSLRREIRTLLRQLRVPAVFITHDQEEAMELGDAIAILNRGRLEQVGTPDDIYNDPQTEFVATFLGAANVIGARVVRGAIEIDSERTLPLIGSALLPSDNVKVIFRPEDVVLGAPTGLVETPFHLGRAEVLEVSFSGAVESLMIRLSTMSSKPAGAGPVRYQTGAFQSRESASGIILKVMRSKWDVRRLRLRTGDPISVGLRTFKVLSD